jgi:formylglycine-generating enzyme required for sulfatase activity
VKVGLDGNVYVADTGNKRVRVYTPEGDFLFDIGTGTGGTLQGQLDEPVGLAFNPLTGDLYVAEPWNTRIQSFNAASGQSLSMWSVNMWFNNRNSYNRPYLAISPDGQRVYTVDMDERSRVVSYSLSGVPLLSFDQPDVLESGTLGLRAPAGLDFDAQGRLYVVDSNQAKIFVFPAAEIGGSVALPPSTTGQTSEEQSSAGQGFPPGSDILQAGSANSLWSPIVQDMNGAAMAYVPSGCFKAGVPNGTTPEVCLNSYWIGVTEVTNADYAECVAAEACTPPSNRQAYDDPTYSDHPVVFVTWEQAQQYATWFGGTLPSEAQWEYAARGPEGAFFPWGGDDPTCDITVMDGCDGISPVGEHPGGIAWVGAFDLAGNVWEWTSDTFDPDYYDTLIDGMFDPTAAAVDTDRTVRGGSWADTADNLRSTSRAGRNPNSRFGTVGFRVVLPAIQITEPQDAPAQG